MPPRTLFTQEAACKSPLDYRFTVDIFKQAVHKLSLECGGIQTMMVQRLRVPGPLSLACLPEGHCREVQIPPRQRYPPPSWTSSL